MLFGSFEGITAAQLVNAHGLDATNVGKFCRTVKARVKQNKLSRVVNWEAIMVATESLLMTVTARLATICLLVRAQRKMPDRFDQQLCLVRGSVRIGFMSVEVLDCRKAEELVTEIKNGDLHLEP